MHSTATRRAAVAAPMAIAAAYAVHAAPLRTINDGFRNRMRPGLAGIGRHDRVALTFDDGPDPASTPQFIEELDRLGWHATFFLLGEMVRRTPSLVGELVAAGHEVAVH